MALTVKYCCGSDGIPYGAPDYWLKNIISYCFFFGLGLTIYDREYARHVLYGLPEVWSRYSLYWLSHVKDFNHEENSHSWGHAVNLLTLFIKNISPNETGLYAELSELKETAGSIGLVSGIRLALDDPEFANSLFDGATDERERCDDENLVGRFIWIRDTINDIWSKKTTHSNN